MNNQPKTNKHSEEIDLGYLINKTGAFFKNLIKSFFLILAFFQKYIILTVVLIIIGIAYGIYKDTKGQVAYKNETIVIPNFESVDYLYGKVDAFNSKISLRDTVFLKEVLGGNYAKIRRIEVEPIVDIYNFVSKSREHIDVFRILFHNQELSDFIEDMATSKYYKYHKLNFTILGKESSEKMVYDILQYFNSNEHFLEYKKVVSENTLLEIGENSKMLAQVDSVFNVALTFPSYDKSNLSVFINDNSHLNNLLISKRELLEERTNLLMRNTDEADVIKLVSGNYNLKHGGFIIKNVIKYPILLTFIFSLIFFIRYIYKKMKAIAETN